VGTALPVQLEPTAGEDCSSIPGLRTRRFACKGGLYLVSVLHASRGESGNFGSSSMPRQPCSQVSMAGGHSPTEAKNQRDFFCGGRNNKCVQCKGWSLQNSFFILS